MSPRLTRCPGPGRHPRPSAGALAAAEGRRVPDVVAPGLGVLFVGINPGLYSAATGHHFARPGNRFWPALHAAGFTERRLSPCEPEALLARGLGVTNLVARATATAAELHAAELVRGRRRLESLVRRFAPRWVAFLGLTAFRTAMDRPRAQVGAQPERFASARVWLLPNPSGLNAQWTLPALAEAFRALAAAARPAGASVPPRSPAARRSPPARTAVSRRRIRGTRRSRRPARPARAPRA